MNPTIDLILPLEETPFKHIYHGGPTTYGGASEWPILKWKLDLGANPNMLVCNLVCNHGKKSTPLMVAAGVSNLVAGRLLIQYGADTQYSLQVAGNFPALPYFIQRSEKKWIEFECERGLRTWLVAEKEAKSVKNSTSPFTCVPFELMEKIRNTIIFLSREMPDPELYSPNPEFKTIPYFCDSIKWTETQQAEIAAKEHCNKDPLDAIQDMMEALDLNPDSSSENIIPDSESDDESLDTTPVDSPPHKRQRTKY